MRNVGSTMQTQETVTIASKLVYEIKKQVTQTWFAAVAEQNAKRKAALLEQYRALKRSYEAQMMLAAQ